MQLNQDNHGSVLIQINQIIQIIVRKRREQVNIRGYLIIPMNVQVVDVIHLIQVQKVIGQVHHIQVLQFMRGTSAMEVTCAILL